jgi:hypothetical protein
MHPNDIVSLQRTATGEWFGVTRRRITGTAPSFSGAVHVAIGRRLESVTEQSARAAGLIQ